MKKYVEKNATPLMAAAIVAVVDLFSKEVALDNLAHRGREVIPGFFDLSLAFNRGVSFSMFADTQNSLNILGYSIPADVWLPVKFTLISAVAIVLFLWWMKGEECPHSRLGLGLIVGGAIGNMVDRIRFGAVVDFLDFYYQGWHFPTFNIADSAITVGVFLILWSTLRQYRADKRRTHTQ